MSLRSVAAIGVKPSLEFSSDVELVSHSAVSADTPPEPTLFYKRDLVNQTVAHESKTDKDSDISTDCAPSVNAEQTIDLPESTSQIPLTPKASNASTEPSSAAPPIIQPAGAWPVALPASLTRALLRWQTWRWRRLFPLYRLVKLPCMAPISLISLLVALLYVVVNVAILIPLLVQMINGTGTSTGDCGGQHNGGGQCVQVAQDTYNAASTLGTIGAINFLLLMLPTNRNSILTLLLGISVDRSLTWHKWIARYTVFIFAVHGAGILTSYWYQGLMHGSALDGPTDLNGSGEISLLAGFALVLTSLRPLRRLLFEAFLRIHWLLFIVFIIFGMIHQGTFIALVAVAAVPWAIDWWLRIKVWRRPVSVMAVRALAADVVRIDFSKQDFHYSAGQWIFVCIPEVTPFEWHPFSLSSSHHHTSLMIHVRALGDWTRRLQTLALSRDAQSKPLRMYVEGPYGTLELPLAQYKSIVMVSGGIGITPLQSVFNSLVHQMREGHKLLNQLRFVWSVREIDLIHSMHGARLHANARADTNSGFVLPAAFQPDLLSVHRPTSDTAQAAVSDSSTSTHLPSEVQSVIQTSFHLTTGGQAMSSEHLAALQETYGHTFQVGRLDIAAVLRAVKDGCRASGDKRVAVLVCGPPALVRDVKRAVAEWSDETCMFDWHNEEFQF